MAGAVKEMGMSTVRSPASSEFHDTTAAEFQALVAAIEASDIVVPELAATALATVLAGVITGEGPTAQGRPHFSRSLDESDTAWCERILVSAGGRHGAPVSRLEAERLIEIDAAASERSDGGRFDDLMVKAVTHHVLATTGRTVPPRDVALDPQVPVASWASRFAPADIDGEVLRWIASHTKGKRGLGGPLMTILGLLVGASPLTTSLTTLVDLLA
jgi:hypothetical protein